MQVDNTSILVDILDADKAENYPTRIYAISTGGECEVQQEIMRLARKHPEDFKKLLGVLRQIAEGNERFFLHVKRCSNPKCRDIYEIRAGQVRLFYFEEKEHQRLVICTNMYWKAKSSRREQNACFLKSEKIREQFYRAKVAGNTFGLK